MKKPNYVIAAELLIDKIDKLQRRIKKLEGENKKLKKTINEILAVRVRKEIS